MMQTFKYHYFTQCKKLLPGSYQYNFVRLHINKISTVQDQRGQNLLIWCADIIQDQQLIHDIDLSMQLFDSKHRLMAQCEG